MYKNLIAKVKAHNSCFFSTTCFASLKDAPNVFLILSVNLEFLFVLPSNKYPFCKKF